MKKRLIYQVALGAATSSKLYKKCIESVADYCEQHGIDHYVQTQPILMIKPNIFDTNRSVESYEKHGGFLPIYEKENAFDWFSKGYDQIAIIDADIYVRPGSPNIFDDLPSNVDFGACVERDMPITGAYAQKLKNYTHMQYTPLTDVQWEWKDWAGAKFYNMGMMVMNKSIVDYFHGESARQFITRPEFKRFVDGDGAWKWSTDQTLLNWWVKKAGVKVKDMSWTWNALYKGVKDEEIPKANFVHFFLKDKLPQQGENVEQLMKDIGSV
jgi:hypothetical protein